MTTRLLDADNQRWEQLGAAIAAVARLIRQACNDSCYCSDRPSPLALAVRMSESIDDQIDAPAWTVVDAAARLWAQRPAP